MSRAMAGKETSLVVVRTELRYALSGRYEHSPTDQQTSGKQAKRTDAGPYSPRDQEKFLQRVTCVEEIDADHIRCMPKSFHNYCFHKLPVTTLLVLNPVVPCCLACTCGRACRCTRLVDTCATLSHSEILSDVAAARAHGRHFLKKEKKKILNKNQPGVRIAEISLYQPMTCVEKVCRERNE